MPRPSTAFAINTTISRAASSQVPGYGLWRAIPKAKADLDETWQIAERGAMKLHMADIHLHRAHLCRDKAALAEARKLIEETGYHCRDDELREAREAAQHWRQQPDYPLPVEHDPKHSP